MIERCNPLFAVNPITSQVAKPSKNTQKQKKGDHDRRPPLFADSGRASSEIPEWLQEFRENLVDDKEPQKERRDPLYSEIPEWLQDFRENLVDEVSEHRESHVSSSHEVSLEPTSKRREDLGKHSVYTHFPKDRNCVNLETIIDMQSWCRTWPPNGSSRIHAKQKLFRKHKGACKSSWSPRGNQKSFTLTIPWNSAKLVKIFPGIIARPHHTDQKQMGLLKEQCAE